MFWRKITAFSWLRETWWVFSFCCLTGLVYLHAVKNRNASLQEMAFRCREMEKHRFEVLQEKEDLSLRIASQHDPAWVEMVLMREIGVVPEGWVKVHFR